ncbi:MAG: hypothetical protein ACJ8ER_06940 [Allosphingosinicella sp.]
MKKIFVAVGAMVVITVAFIIWASVNGLVIVIAKSPDQDLSGGWIVVDGHAKPMKKVGSTMVGAYTVRLDGPVTFEVKVGARRRRISFGYATPGEFQINEVAVQPSGQFTVRHHTIP